MKYWWILARDRDRWEGPETKPRLVPSCSSADDKDDDNDDDINNEYHSGFSWNLPKFFAISINTLN